MSLKKRASALYAPEHPIRVGVVGTGQVGATFAYTVLLRGLANEVVLIDKDARRAEGEAMDLRHAMPFLPPARVVAGGYEALQGAQVVMISAGVGQRPGETRIDLLRRNADVFREIVPQILHAAPGALLLVATNPVDVLTYATWRISGLPKERVIGSGTVLDTARFRSQLSAALSVDPRSVHAHILGEHGDSEVPAWSLANMAGLPLKAYAAEMRVGDAVLDEVFVNTRDAAYQIIERKGATYYAVAVAMARIVEAILRDEHSVLPVSTLLEGQYGLEGVCLSVPSLIGADGLERVLELPLAEDELTALRRSGELLKELIYALEL